MKRFGVFLAAAALMTSLSAHAAVTSLSAEANAAFVADFAKKPGVHVNASGLMYRMVHTGYGKRPGPTDTCTVYYTGTLINGTMFDGTEDGLPAQFTPTDVIPGWTEALENMREGDKWQIVIPARLAYGSRGAGNGLIPPNQTLVFDLTLVTVTVPKEEPKDDDQSSPGNGAQ